MPRPKNTAVTARVLAALLAISLAGSARGAPVTNVLPSVPSLVRSTPTEFRLGRASGVTTGDTLRLSPEAPAANGVRTGTLESAVVMTSAPFTELLPSWNAVTPEGTWVSLEVRAEIGGRWTRYYSYGTWFSWDAPAGGPRRASVDGQSDADAKVLTDVVRFNRSATRYQYRLRLSSSRAGVSPEVSLVTFTATSPTKVATGGAQRAAWGRVLNVPARSQMVFPEGEGWCSPTSVSMVLAYWGHDVTVPEAARGTYDAQYEGTGNWAFNAAFAASRGFTAYATRLGGLADVERHILAGVPVVMSLGWGAGELPNAPIPKSEGHLIVIVGFDARGNVVVNDPAGRTDAEVRRVYDRATLEKLWLTHSGGTVYVITRG
ncbi:peptidase C39 family protein [Deinococcus pimensis]|uniref:peptidase C39 family protein n=1 Tax=Deinococcus pimensis TaxID=309888 RepID=UPI0005EADB8F|nr:peptidase C39 family protein [Deinococcus pimensis]